MAGAPNKGYGAWAPHLPGCIARGDTPDAADTQMREPITFHLEGLREDGLEIPLTPSTAATAVVDVPAA